MLEDYCPCPKILRGGLAEKFVAEFEFGQNFGNFLDDNFGWTIVHDQNFAAHLKGFEIPVITQPLPGELKDLGFLKRRNLC